jgi:hypothetical protein
VEGYGGSINPKQSCAVNHLLSAAPEPAGACTVRRARGILFEGWTGRLATTSAVEAVSFGYGLREDDTQDDYSKLSKGSIFTNKSNIV